MKLVEPARRLTQKVPANVRGIALMLGGTLLVTINLIFIRNLRDLPPSEVVFLRYAFALIALVPWIVKTQATVFHTRFPGLHALRAVLAVASSIAWVYAVPRVPLAEAMALNFLSPIFLAIGAVLFLGERSLGTRWTGAAFGFAGMLIILRPGFEVVTAASLIVVFSAVIWSVCLLLMKILLRTDSALTIVAYLYVFGLLIVFPFCLPVWEWPTLQHLLWLVLLGPVSAIAQLAFVQAYKLAEATAVVPADFMRLVWASMIGYAVFGEVPEVWTLIGGGLIFAATAYLTLAERARASV